MAHELEYEVLDAPQVDQALRDLPGWQRDDIRVRRLFEFESFPKAIEFVNRVATVAEDYNHHPDITINFKKVTIAFWTHKKNATTRADIEVAKAVQKVA